MNFIFTLSVILTACAAALIVDLLIALAVAAMTVLCDRSTTATTHKAGIFRKAFLKVFKWGLLTLLIPPAIYLHGNIVGTNLINVNRVTISIDSLPPALEGYKIAQISDLHLMSMEGREKYLERLVRKINAQSPDLIVFTGDLVTESPDEIDGLDRILGGLEARYGVFSVLGNHDYCIYNREITMENRDSAVASIVRKQENMGWTVLQNQSVDFPEGLSVIGINNTSSTRYFPAYGDLDKAMANAGGEVKVLLSHDPSYWETAIEKYPDIDLTLSGHTHAMQLSFAGISPSRLLYDRYRGLYQEETDAGTISYLYVNIGIGETLLMSRIGTPPEVTIITLTGGY